MADPMNAPLAAPMRALNERANLAAALNVLPDGCARFFYEHLDVMLTAPGSGHNHQFWHGGYADHLDEILGIAATLYSSLSALRPLPFTLVDALLTLFLHDIEKPYKRLPQELRCDSSYSRMAHTDPHGLQVLVCADYGISLTDEHRNALAYVHGELDDYSKTERVAGPLAAFCHDCDYWSARGWFNEPRQSGPLPDTVTPALASA